MGLVVALLAVCISCGSEAESTSRQTRPEDFLRHAALQSGENLVYVPGPIPAATNGPPVVLTPDGYPILAGQTAFFDASVSVSAAFSTVYVAVQGVAGHWEATVPSTPYAGLAFLIGEHAPAQFRLEVAVGGPAGVGPASTIAISLGVPASSSQTFSSTDVPKAIADFSQAESSIGVASVGVLSEVTVTVNISHTYVTDLVLSLVAPSGTIVTLSAYRGGIGDNYTNTTFSDAAATPIASGTAPFTGSFRPESPLSALVGQSGTGTWRLRVADDDYGDTGAIQSWSITLR